MTTIHLTDAQRDTFAACGIIIIDGDVRTEGYSLGGASPVTYVAPEGWRILTEPCGTCGGAGVAVPTRTSPSYDCPNPDCVGGRRVITLTATCPIGWWNQDDCTDPRCTEGKVTLGRFTIPALLPVAASHDGVNVAAYVFVDEGGAELWAEDGDGDYDLIELLPLDPLPRPGQFIARPQHVHDQQGAPT